MKSIKTFTGLFEDILKECDYCLDQFVTGSSFSLTDDKSEEFQNKITQMVDMAPIVCREADNRNKFFSTLCQKEYFEKNKEFAQWLEKYIDAVNIPYKEAAFVRNMKQEEFEKMSQYCFAHMILSVTEKDKIDESFGKIKDMFALRKIIFTFINLIIVENYSKEYAFSTMERMFGFSDEYCEFWWDLVEKNEEKLWRIMIMKKYDRIENKLNQLLNSSED